MENQFCLASRLRLRFDTKQGQLSVEDLWHLPLTTTKANVTSLDDIAVALNKELKESDTTSFVHTRSRKDTANELRFSIVLHIINTLKTESEMEAARRAAAAKKDQILELIAKKEVESLDNKSIDELREIARSL